MGGDQDRVASPELQGSSRGIRGMPRDPRGKLADIQNGETVNAVSDLVANQCATIAEPALKHLTTYVVPRMPPEANYAISDPEQFASFAGSALRGYRSESEEANANLEQLIEKELLRQKKD